MEDRRASPVRSSTLALNLPRVASCLFDRIGFPEGTLTLKDVAGETSEPRSIQAVHHKDLVGPLIGRLEQQVRITDLVGIATSLPELATAAVRLGALMGIIYRVEERYMLFEPDNFLIILGYCFGLWLLFL
jgi:hypothetical protein